MRRFVFVVLLFVVATFARAQEQVFSNFHCDGKVVWWERRYDGARKDLAEAILSNGNLKSVQELNGKYFAEVIDYLPKEGYNLFSGRAIITQDSLGYVVSFKTISYKLGSRSRSKARTLSGSGDIGAAKYNLDDALIKKGEFKTGKPLIEVDEFFTKLFTL